MSNELREYLQPIYNIMSIIVPFSLFVVRSPWLWVPVFVKFFPAIL